MPNLAAGTYPSFFDGYLRLVDANTIPEAIDKYSRSILDFFQSISNSKLTYRYAEGKWTVKEILQHVIDTERIFAYRALRIARHDQTPLPGFDEKSYAASTDANARSWESLLQEFEAVRKSTDLLLQSFSREQLEQTGTTNGETNTAKAISFVIFGHILHHINIVKQRYL